MGLDGHNPQSIRNFGGLYTLTDPTNLPVWASPNCQDVEFYPGLVKTRPGLTSVFGTFGPNAQCNYTKTYIDSQEFIRTLIFYSGGGLSGGATLRKEDVATGTLSNIATNLLSSYCNSTSLFSREYMAFSDGKFGVDLPRQFDDSTGTNIFDRVSQVGPGAPPSATEENISAPIAASPTGLVPLNQAIVASPNGLSESGNVVTVTLTADFLIQATKQIVFSGDTVKITGAGVGGYNGTWVVASVINARQFTFINTTTGLANSGNGTLQTSLVVITSTATLPAQFAQSGVGTSVAITGATSGTYNTTYTIRFVQAASTGFTALGPQAILGMAASGGGTVALSGNIIAGKHGVTVMFVNREGYITEPAPPVYYTASGSKRVILANIPIGPPNIVARIVAFTPISSTSFFYDTGTNQTIPNSEMVINDNTTTTAVFDFTDDLLEAGTNVDDLFDLVELAPAAGVTSYSSRLFWWGERNKVQNFLNLTFDGGFTQSGTIYPLGWIPDSTNYAGGGLASAAVSGQAYSITGDGATAIRGLMAQSAYQDAFGDPIIAVNTAYSVRVRVMDGGGGIITPLPNLQIELNSVSTGLNSKFTLNLAGATLSNSHFAEYTGSLIAAQSSIPSDLQLRIYIDNTLGNGEQIFIDNIEIYPTNQPYLATQVRASKVEDPESYSGIDGFLLPAPENGQRVTNCFVIRNILYIVKERSLYATQDDGVSEPANWSIQEISSKVGTFSVKGVGLGDEWAVIAAESGLWYFTGGLIAEDNKLSKEIQPTWDSINWTYGHLISVAVDTQRKRIYVSVPYGSSTVPNKVLTLDYTEGFGELQEGIGRKWCPWSISAASVALIQRNDLTLKVFFGNSNNNGRVFQLDTTGSVYNDVLTGIDSFWQSGFFQAPVRQNFGYLSGNIVGSGSMSLSLYRGDMTNVTAIRGWLMNLLGYTNMERTIQKQGFRMSVKFECTALAIPSQQYFSMQGVDIWTAPAVWAPVRGVNA